MLSIREKETLRSGVYETWGNRVDGSIDAHRFAVNVDPREGDLKQTGMRRLLQNLDPVKAEFRYADQFETSAIEQAGFNQSVLLMVALVILLLGEQIMAYVASFHPARGARR